MLFDIRDWARFAQQQRRFTRNNSFFGDPQITHTVSKNFEGGYRQDLIQTLCESPEKCAHLHFPGAFDCKSLESSKCDSEFSQKYLTGRLDAGYQATFGHDEADPKLEPYEQRGYFFGGFALSQGRDRIVDGVMDGNCNVGIVREPLQNPIETCHHIGRWYGRVHASVRLPEQTEVAFLTANLAIDVTYNRTPSYLETKFTGTLEGMLIRECEQAAD